MKDQFSLTEEQKKAVANMPKSAAECGMEEAFGLGLLNDPQPDLPQKQSPYQFRHSRTDFTRS